MTENRQVRCINKSDRHDVHNRIKNIGGLSADGTPWKLDQQEAISGIENEGWNFYVSVAGHTVGIVIAISRFGYKYLKTQHDKEDQNNLLSLPECP